MKISSEQLKEDSRRDLYWTRIHIRSEDGQHETTILLCVSHEYLWEKLKNRDYTRNQLTEWLSEFLKEIESKGEEIFNEPIHYRVFATTDEGKENGYVFLKDEISK